MLTVILFSINFFKFSFRSSFFPYLDSAKEPVQKVWYFGSKIFKSTCRMQAIIIKVEIHLAYLEKKNTKRNRSLCRHTVMIQFTPPPTSPPPPIPPRGAGKGRLYSFSKIRRPDVNRSGPKPLPSFH